MTVWSVNLNNNDGGGGGDDDGDVSGTACDYFWRICTAGISCSGALKCDAACSAAFYNNICSLDNRTIRNTGRDTAGNRWQDIHNLSGNNFADNIRDRS